MDMCLVEVLRSTYTKYEVNRSDRFFYGGTSSSRVRNRSTKTCSNMTELIRFEVCFEIVHSRNPYFLTRRPRINSIYCPHAYIAVHKTA